MDEEKKDEFYGLVRCPTCKGVGRVPASNPGNCDPLYETCPTCAGTGRVKED